MNPVLINTRLGVSKGKPRVWTENNHLRKAGIEPGQVLKVCFHTRKRIVEIGGEPSSDDDKIKVSKRTYKGVEKPLVELRHERLTELFGHDAQLRIIARNGKLIIRLHHLDQNARERVQRLSSKLDAGEPLTIGSLFHGGGTLDHAMHAGFSKAGVDSYVQVVNEKDSRFLGASVQNNPHLWRDDTLFIDSPIEKIDLSNACYLDIVIAGVPCTGASLSGRASKGLAFAEQHETAGALFYSFLQFVQVTNPAVVILENVKQYQACASYAVILSVLRNLGYHVEDAILNGNDFGALESRERLYMVATTDGVPPLNFESLVSMRKKEATAAEVLERLADDDPAWRTYPYLDDAERKAKKKGNGFKRAYITPDSTQTPTIKRTNHKCQSDGVFVQHPVDPQLSRLPRALEHARLKTVPPSIIENLSETLACEVLGQGIVYVVAESLAMGIAEQCLAKSSLSVAA